MKTRVAGEHSALMIFLTAWSSHETFFFINLNWSRLAFHAFQPPSGRFTVRFLQCNSRERREEKFFFLHRRVFAAFRRYPCNNFILQLCNHARVLVLSKRKIIYNIDVTNIASRYQSRWASYIFSHWKQQKLQQNTLFYRQRRLLLCATHFSVIAVKA